MLYSNTETLLTNIQNATHGSHLANSGLSLAALFGGLSRRPSGERTDGALSVLVRLTLCIARGGGCNGLDGTLSAVRRL